MNIHAKSGDKVVFKYPDKGTPNDQERANQYLRVGQIYTVESTKTGDWRTNVSLREIPSVTFNSVLFEDLWKLKEIVNGTKKCPNCKSLKTRDSNDLGFWLCLNCGLLWKFIPIPTKEEEERRKKILASK